MTDRTESGRLSIAGFLYQIVGSGAESCRLTRHVENDEDADEILEMEQLGQDLVAVPSDGGIARLIQFKYSSKYLEVKPNELRKILETFLACVDDAKKQIDEFTYELITNRPFHPDIDDWAAADLKGDQAELAACIKKTSRTTLHDLTRLCEIYTPLEIVRKSNEELENELKEAAARLGVLENEMESGIDGVIGLLTKKSTPAESPRIFPSVVRARLAGHDNAIELKSSKSVNIRTHDIDSFQQDESRTNDFSTSPIVPRVRLEDISNAILNFPVVVIHGTGGCGKSIALADVAKQFLNDKYNPPGFCMMTRASGFTPQEATIAIAKWRGAGAKIDADFQFAFCRLEAAYGDAPVIAFFVDAIDEKPKERLSDPTREFISNLIRMATNSRRERGTHQLSVVLACRHREEASNIRRVGNPIAAERDVEFVPMADYSKEELLEAVTRFEKVKGPVAERLVGFLASDDLLTMDSQRGLGGISDEVIEVLSNPVFWFLFSELTEDEQHGCLDGDSSALCQLGGEYVKWFKDKASSRMQLRLGICEAAFHAAASTFDSPTDVGNFDRNWLEPIVAKTKLSESDAELLFLEAASAGIVLTEAVGNEAWRWKFPWFCTFLVESGGLAR